MITLRPYQERGLAAIRQGFVDGLETILYVAPTGSGKTVLFTFIAHHGAQMGTRICIIVHRRELLRQASRTLDAFGVPHGVVAPGYPTTGHLVQVASKDTLIHRLHRYPAFDLLICDEAHHATAETYRKIWRHYAARVLGVTATPCRLSGAGLKTEFERMIVGPSVAELQQSGHLAPSSVYAPPHVVDLKGLHCRAGDYKREELEALMDHRNITGNAIEHYSRLLNGRPTLVFCCSVAHAEHTAAQYRAAGYRAESVDGTMAEEVRDDRIAAIGDGRLNVLTSCDLIGEGLDVPGVYGVQDLAPSRSLSRVMQRWGRALRPADGKRALILDHVGNCMRHGLPEHPRNWTLELGAEKTDAKREPPVRQCPECFHAHTPSPVCPACGHVYQASKKPVPKESDGELRLVTPEAGAELFRAAQTLKDFHAWAKATGRSSGAAWYAFKRRKASNRLERAAIGGGN